MNGSIFQCHHHHRRHRADEAGDRADRQVDVARHDDQQHAQRHDDDVAVLQDQVGHVDRLEQRAVGGELEEHHDGQQRQQQRIVADIGLDEAHDVRLRPAACGGHVGHVSLPMIS